MFDQSWPWYISGPLIGLTIPLLYYFKNKAFGVSSSFTHVCTVMFKSNTKDYLRSNVWNLQFVTGIILAGVLFWIFSGNTGAGNIESSTILNVPTNVDTAYPPSFYSIDYIFSIQGLIYIVIGGLLIGFGTRYANGCTSGHAISGLSNRQLTSLIAVIGFFIGGLIVTYGLRDIVETL